MKQGIAGLVGFAVLAFGASFIGSPALATCSQDCRTLIKNEFKTCKGACAMDKACKRACSDEKKADAAACKAATNPTPPSCGEATTTTTSTNTTTTTITGAHCGQFPDCNGACPVGARCARNFDEPECRCFPVDVTPCFDSGFPQCGGVCLDGKVCQAAKGTDGGLPVFEGCACVAPASVCGQPPDACSFGVCSPGEECVSDVFPGQQPLCQTGCRPPTTTTTSTSTTTLPPCGGGPSGCSGACPSGLTCAFVQDMAPFCGCVPDGSQPCGSAAFPFCNGQCPSGQVCGAVSNTPNAACFCRPVGTTACGDAQTPTCRGVCPASQQCGAFRVGTFTLCACVDSATSCACGPVPGVCPPNQFCELGAIPPGCGCSP